MPSFGALNTMWSPSIRFSSGYCKRKEKSELQSLRQWINNFFLWSFRDEHGNSRGAGSLALCPRPTQDLFLLYAGYFVHQSKQATTPGYVGLFAPYWQLFESPVCGVLIPPLSTWFNSTTLMTVLPENYRLQINKSFNYCYNFFKSFNYCCNLYLVITCFFHNLNRTGS